MSSISNEQLSGKYWWRSIDDVVDANSLSSSVNDEFPEGAQDLFATGSDRRHFLKIMGSSMALAGLGLAGCRRWPQEHIVPYASRPEGTMPGAPEYFASCFDFGGISQGVLVTSNDGRPTKIEGNREHPDSKGKTDSFSQAAILDLYDPDRSRGVKYKGEISSLASFAEWAEVYLPERGKGLAFLVEPSSSPTIQRMKRSLKKRYPELLWVEYAPLDNINQRQGLAHAFGGHWIPVHDFSQAEVIVSLDSNFLGASPTQVPDSMGWCIGRKPEKASMNRLLIAESRLSPTGARADERVAIKPSRMVRLAEEIAFKIAGITSDMQGDLSAEESHWIDLVLESVQNAAKKKTLVVAGASQPPIVHYLVARINEATGASGQSVLYRLVDNDSDANIQELSKAIDSGSIQGLVIVGGNPVFSAPKETDFAEKIKSLPMSAHLSYYENETSNLCKWHVNQSHWLEAWSDGRSLNGTLCIGQPLIEPLFDGVSDIEFLAILAGESAVNGQALVQSTFNVKEGGLNQDWRQAVHDGVAKNESYLENPPVNRNDFVSKSSNAIESVFEVCFVPSASVWDGRYANNGWMQELPDAITKLTWDNAVQLSPKTASELGVKQGDVMEITVGDDSIEIACIPVPGTADGALILPIGYGREFGGRVCSGAGVNVYPLRSSNTFWSGSATCRKTGQTYPLATTQMHFDVNSTPGKGTQERLPMLYREGTINQFEKDPAFARHAGHALHSLSIYEERQFDGAQYKWGMSLDLSTCTGCNACVVACQAENNIPIVGKDQVLMGREMHWIRIDRYFAFKDDGHGHYDANKLDSVAFQPVSCTHCENAPCEEVCPVAATVHDTDGLNVMVYNRCIGTRYCSNNCPFKVRRFNYFDYFRRDPLRSTGLLQVQPDYYVKTQSGGKTLRAMQFNPDVTVRMRGVMEKCDFCSSRIQRAKIATKNKWMKLSQAEKEKDPRVKIEDGTIVPACSECCPADCITFGDLLDKDSAVSKLHSSPRSYEMLEELNIKSRSKYLASITNPVHEPEHHSGGHH